MKFDIDRMCRLAGISHNRSRMLREGAHAEEGMMHETEDEGMMHNEEDIPMDAFADAATEADEDIKEEKLDSNFGSGSKEEEPKKDEGDQEVEVDEAVLVSELRRMKNIMAKSKILKEKKRARLQEMQLRAVIDQEVKNVINDLQLNSGWVYGNRKPTRSRKGYSHQGSLLKGIGFYK